MEAQSLKKKANYNILIILFLILALAACTGAPQGELAPTRAPEKSQEVENVVEHGLFVNVSKTQAEISPLVYGTNYGPWVAVPFDMLPKAVDAKVTIIRWPGGAWGDNNNLQGYQIDQFIGFCKMLGAEPSISVRLKNGAPEAAAALVKYANIEKGYNVHYWSVGNEPTLYSAELKEDYDTEQFNKEWRAIAQAMKAVDPSIKIIGPELHQFTGNPDANPKDSKGRDWMTEFLRANGDLVDIVSFHRYPFPKDMSGKSPTIPQLLQDTQEWDGIITYLHKLIQDTTGKDLPIAVTEVNSNWSQAIGSETSPDSFYNALWWADVLGRLIRQNVMIVNQWILVTTGGQGGWGIIGRDELRPSYYVYMMYQHFGEELLYASSDETQLSLYAARRKDGALTLMIINLSAMSKEKPLTLTGFKAGGAAETWRFDQDHQAVQVDPTDIGEGTMLNAPAYSVTLLVIPPAR